jgi:hypothetical protein
LVTPNEEHDTADHDLHLEGTPRQLWGRERRGDEETEEGRGRREGGETRRSKCKRRWTRWKGMTIRAISRSADLIDSRRVQARYWRGGISLSMRDGL